MKRILIAIDIQNDFTHERGALSNKECEEAAVHAAKYIEDFRGELLILTKDTHGTDYEHTLERTKQPILHCTKGSWGWEINTIITEAVVRLQHHRDVQVAMVEKCTFGFDGWRDLLDDKIEPDTEIEMIGVCTGYCVLANAIILRALYPNTIIRVRKDYCACATHDSHLTALQILQTQQIDVE